MLDLGTQNKIKLAEIVFSINHLGLIIHQGAVPCLDLNMK